jgi:hypothetical protein
MCDGRYDGTTPAAPESFQSDPQYDGESTKDPPVQLCPAGLIQWLKAATATHAT